MQIKKHVMLSLHCSIHPINTTIVNEITINVICYICVEPSCARLFTDGILYCRVSFVGLIVIVAEHRDVDMRLR